MAIIYSYFPFVRPTDEERVDFQALYEAIHPGAANQGPDPDTISIVEVDANVSLRSLYKCS